MKHNCKTFMSVCLFLVLGFSSAYSDVGLMSTGRVHDFGEVGIDYNLFHTFTIVNYADTAITIDSVTVTCDCSYITFLDSVLAPGDSVDIRLKFNTKNYYGPVSKSILIHSNSAVTPLVDLFYKATVGQWYYGLQPIPSSLFFLPKNKSKILRIANRQLEGASITELIVEDTFFTVTILKADGTKGESLKIEVTPLESLTNGNYMSNFRIKLETAEDLEPVYISIPVKIVRY